MFWVNSFFWLIGGIGLVATIKTLVHLRSVHKLPPSQVVPPPARPQVSVVLAARDEADRIDTTIQRLAQQEGVSLQLIVVNDRSTDLTAKILSQLSKQHPRLEVIEVKTLPEGWLGKCHACHLGAQRATADWILFTDADVWLHPDVVARAVQTAIRAGVDHICLTPGIMAVSPLVRAWHLLFLLGLAEWIDRANRDSPKAQIGIGAFNLVRKDAYDASGGYEKLRLTVVDDIRLGLLIRRAGGKTRAYLGEPEVMCQWAADMPGMIQIVEKNFFAAVNYQTPVVFAASIAMTLYLLGAFVGPLTGLWSGLAAGLGFYSFILPAAILARRVGEQIRIAFLVPLSWPGFIAAMVNSAMVTLRQGGIKWRDTFYPLAALRAGNVK